MENFEKFWSTTVTELIQSFEGNITTDICTVYRVPPHGKPNKPDRQYKTLAYVVGEQNLFQHSDRQLKAANNGNAKPNHHVIAASLGKKNLRIILDLLYIKLKDMLQPPSQGNNFEDLEPQQSWAQPEQSAPIISTESQAMIIDSKLSARARVLLQIGRIHNYAGCIVIPPLCNTSSRKSKKAKRSKGRFRKSVFSDWGRVLNISLKTQHKYYTIRVDIVLNPTKDTEFILMPWCTQLGGIWVRWFSGEWKLAQRKSREIFQASFRFPADTTEDAIYSKFTPDGESLL
ncbi:hypothetical protein RclHR1_09110009 [Rhizophagus clarus]|uniref:Uncharacterized protein n=1 Tax=Rhizophagus clarus TaxID=94130 RepID=A0A2Z6SHQ3_9GLOM|nr:hypothetical protein RclHR1_09110009 [Rhizophagus clarus]